MITKTINVYDLGVFEAKLKELNKKAAKAGVAAVSFVLVEEVKEKKTYKWGSETFVEKDEEVFSHFVVEITFEPVIFPGGWSLVGVIDHVESLVKSVPGAGDEPLVPFLDRGAVCDHCGQDRQRNETFVLRGEKGSLVQIGRTCLHLFLGISPERALAGAGYVCETTELDEPEFVGGRVTRGYELGFYLANAAAVIRTSGWRSRSAVRENGGRATADAAFSNILDVKLKTRSRHGEQLWVDVTEEDGKLAERVVEWLEELGEIDGLNDYLSNLAQIGRNGFVTDKSAGFAASAIVAYGKKVEEKIKASKADAVDEYVCKVGEKVTFNRLTLVKSAGFDTDYGYTFIHRFVDEQGHVIVWRTQTGLDQGEYKVTASVKSHEEYRGEKQTAITRAKTLKLEPVTA